MEDNEIVTEKGKDLTQQTDWELEAYQAQFHAVQWEYKCCVEHIKVLQILSQEIQGKIKKLQDAKDCNEPDTGSDI